MSYTVRPAKEKLRIVIDGMKADNISALCRREGISPTDYYRYRDKLPLTALQNALKSRWYSELSGLVHHSDRGVQYASAEYTECLKAHNATISMSCKGCPLDNAFAESFIKTVKAEEVYLFEYETRQEAYERIPEFIDDVYNQKRLHSALGYLPPNEFEEQIEKSVTLA